MGKVDPALASSAAAGSQNLSSIWEAIRPIVNAAHVGCAGYALPHIFLIAASFAFTSSTSARNSGSSRWCALPMAVALVYAAANASAAARSPEGNAGAALMACCSNTAALTLTAPASARLSVFVSMSTERAASLYASHNFWCAAVVWSAVYEGVVEVVEDTAD